MSFPSFYCQKLSRNLKTLELPQHEGLQLSIVHPTACKGQRHRPRDSVDNDSQLCLFG